MASVASGHQTNCGRQCCVKRHRNSGLHNFNTGTGCTDRHQYRPAATRHVSSLFFQSGSLTLLRAIAQTVILARGSLALFEAYLLARSLVCFLTLSLRKSRRCKKRRNDKRCDGTYDQRPFHLTDPPAFEVTTFAPDITLLIWIRMYVMAITVCPAAVPHSVRSL